MTGTEPWESDESTLCACDSASAGVINSFLGSAGTVVQAGAVHVHPGPQQPTPVIPRQLPAAPSMFAGRVGELVALDRALMATRPQCPETVTGASTSGAPLAVGAVLVSAIGGAGGIGKTWLALTWAHRHLDRFPDGQLFVDLHGFSPASEPVVPAVAVRGFLDALGVDPNRIPNDYDGQAALYRTLVARRRMLIVLDNASTSEQVVPLLPGGPTCTVLITGRHRLASLIDRHGARHLQLDVLSRDEARALLTARLGSDRVAGEHGSVDELIGLCGGHPLALSITSRAVATRRNTPLVEVATELREQGLEMLDHDTDPAASLPSVLSWSLRHLTEEQLSVFALLGITPGPDTTALATAAAAALHPARARRVLSVLEEASLIERRAGGRYVMHDLVRAYAASTAHTLPNDLQEMALTRVMDFHLHTAFTADRVLAPHRALLPLDPPAPGIRLLPLPDAATALAWLEAEHTTLLETQRTAAILGLHHIVWHLAWNLDTFHVRRGHLRDALVVWHTALDSAKHLPDPARLSRSHRLIGRACSRLNLHEQATEHLDRALDLAVRHHDFAEQARTHRHLASAWERRGDDRRALEYARQALVLHRRLEYPVGEAGALNAVGWLAARLGDFDTARDHCQAGLILHRHHCNPNSEANALDSLGYIAHQTGDHQLAFDYYHEALLLYRSQGNAYDVADTLDRIGHLYAALAQHEQALTVWREALELYRLQGRETDAECVKHQFDNLVRTAVDNVG